MRLIVTIPAYNEEKNIGNVIREIPRNIDGVDEVKVLVVNDGSTDSTVESAIKSGADVVISFPSNRGLAVAFKEAIVNALEMGADIIVNIDADGQYNANEIPKLVRPILEGKADIVLGDRQVKKLDHMPLQKKIGNIVASFVTRIASGMKVSDAQTGFRAFSREAALRINVLHGYTYVQETIIAARHKRLRVTEVPVEFRKREGKSRLISNIWSYARRAGGTIIRAYTFYNPLKTFLGIGFIVLFAGFIVGFRVLIHYLSTGMVSPYLPSAVLSALLIIVGFQVMIIGLIGDMIHHLRYLVEEVLYELRKEPRRMILKSDREL